MGSESDSDDWDYKTMTKAVGTRKGETQEQKSKPSLSSGSNSLAMPATGLASTSRSGRKRAASETQNDGVDFKRAVKKTKKGDYDENFKEDFTKAGDDGKKLVQRVWDDELAVLSGMLEFSSNKGADPTADMNAFHDFIKKSLHFNVSEVQVFDMIRRLKKKYENNVAKVKRGGVPTFNNPHEKETHELSNKIWGREGASDEMVANSWKENGKSKQDKNEAKKTLDALKAELLPQKDNQMECHQSREGTFCFSGLTRFQKSLGMAGMDEHVIRRGLELMDPSKRAKFEKSWKDVLQTEMELVAKRAQVSMETTRVIWEAFSSSNN